MHIVVPVLLVLTGGYHQQWRRRLRIAAVADAGGIVVAVVPLLPSMLTNIHFGDGDLLWLVLWSYLTHCQLAGLVMD